MLEIVQRFKPVLFGEPDDLFLHAVQIFVHEIERKRGDALFVIVLCVVDVVDGAVHDEIHQSGNDGFAPFGKEKFFQMIVAQRRIFDVNFADDAHFDLLFPAPLHFRKAFQHRAGDL